MVGAGRLEIASGFATAQGPRPDNQDFGAIDSGTATEQALTGIVAALADGVSGAHGGRIAAELAVRSFIEAYRAQNPLLGIAGASLRAISSYNRWLHSMGQVDPEMADAMTTFTALVLRGREVVAAHVGDSRAWHFRGGVLIRLTEDHVHAQPDLRHVLYRAIGIESEVRLDVRALALEPHDRLLLTSDGVHGAISERALARLLGARGSPQTDADAIVDAAMAAGTRDNATAILIDILALPSVDQDMIAADAERLPILPTPAAGDHVDGFQLEHILSDGRYSRLFAATDGRETIVLKFPKPGLLSDDGARRAFLRENYLGRRIDHPHVARTIALPPDRQSRLYIAMPFYEGETLEARIAGAPLSIASGVGIGVRLARGVAALHRLNVAHRDLKPENVMLLAGGGLKIIDLGVARIARLPDFSGSEIPGTASYMAPELLEGHPGDAASDQYALGVTLYRMFTGCYPYGEVEIFSRPRFGRPMAPDRYRPDMPAWLTAALLRAVSVDPKERFADVEELAFRLEAGSRHAARPVYRPPLIERDPARFWQLVSMALALALIIALATRSRSRFAYSMAARTHQQVGLQYGRPRSADAKKAAFRPSPLRETDSGFAA